MRVRWLGYLFEWHFRVKKIPQYKTIGVGSKTEDNMHCFMLDYDNIFLEHVLRDIKFCQEELGLGDAFVLRSREPNIDENTNKEWGSYHVIFLDKLPYQIYKDYIKYLHVDRKMHTSQKYFNDKMFVLRIREKQGTEPLHEMPKPFAIVPALKKGKYPLSNGHYLVLLSNYDLTNYKPRGKLDKFTVPYFIKYFTGYS